MRALVAACALACLSFAACGNGEGIKGEDCDIDRDCEKGLSCQDRDAVDVCWPDGTMGCSSKDPCPTGHVCVPYGTGSFCQGGVAIDASAED